MTLEIDNKYCIITEDTIEIKNINNLLKEDEKIDLIFKIGCFLIAHPKITKLILFDLFDINNYNNYHPAISKNNIEQSLNLIIDNLIKFILYNKNIEYLQIKELKCYEDHNIIKKSYSIDTAIKFLNSIKQTNIKTVIIDSFITNKAKKTEYWNHGRCFKDYYTNHNFELFDNLLIELSKSEHIKIIKVNNTYYKNENNNDDNNQLIQNSFNIDKKDKLFQNIDGFYKDLINKKYIGNINEFIEQINLILKVFNIKINNIEFIKYILNYYHIYIKNKIISFNTYLNDIRIIISKLNFNITEDIKNYNDLYYNYLSLTNKNLEDYCNEILEINNYFNLNFINDFNLIIILYKLIFNFRNSNNFIINDVLVNTSYFGKLLSFIDNINMLYIDIFNLDEKYCQILYNHCCNKSISSIIFNNNNISNILLIYELLKTNKTIKSLTFNLVKFSDFDINFLIKIIKKSSITELNIISDYINTKSFKKIYKALKINSNITKFEFVSNQIIIDIELYYLSKLLNKNKNLIISISNKLQQSYLYSTYITKDYKDRVKFLE